MVAPTLQSRGRKDWVITLTFTSRRRERTIGRAPACSLQLQDPHISSRHLLIKEGGSGFVIEDCSTNGTWLDGERLQKGVAVELEDGAEVRATLNYSSSQFVYRLL